ncbi:MAG: 4Fe-4S dicluster domain-containing protein [Chloroflexi bacterium]|nr:MAG: 4Fe-4S dicluster domain-containing protein [Chloroflexota bacterium]
MRVKNPPPAKYAFGYKRPPQSGNAINGLNEPEKRRARHVFHNATGESLPWDALDEFFSQINVWGVVKHMLANVWQMRRQEGPVAPQQVQVDDPAAMARDIKQVAKNLGAGIVGITEIFDEALYEGHEVPYKYAIVIGLSMDRSEMEHVPHERAAVEVMRAYREVSRIAIELSEHIRDMGWPARAYGNPNSTDILHIPLAINAGLGELGKHGSMISKEYGSNFRLATVLTDLPLAVDAPVDIGVQDLCATCQRCVLDCPPQAIFPTKQIVRGEEKWYVDFDKCIMYFTKTYGCAICIEVCPWSEPGRGSWLMETLLAKRKP